MTNQDTPRELRDLTHQINHAIEDRMPPGTPFVYAAFVGDQFLVATNRGPKTAIAMLESALKALKDPNRVDGEHRGNRG